MRRLLALDPVWIGEISVPSSARALSTPGSTRSSTLRRSHAGPAGDLASFLHPVSWRSDPFLRGNRFDDQCVDHRLGTFLDIAEPLSVERLEFRPHGLDRLDVDLDRHVAPRHSQARAPVKHNAVRFQALIEEHITRGRFKDAESCIEIFA